MARLARIAVYPFKSFDALNLQQALLTSAAALEHDRRFALRDRQGEFVNAKRMSSIHRLRSVYDPASRRLDLRIEGTTETHTFHVDHDRPALATWLSEYFSLPLEVIENVNGGFPDDLESPGPTVVTTATLAEVASWFPELSLDEVRARFRANLEIDDVEPFWEDRLVADEGRVVRFQIGAAELLGTNPCQRCPVPTRSPWTGEVIYGFAKTFAQHRAETLPSWAPASRFDHFYRLAVNTRAVHSEPVMLRVGDEVRILRTV